MNAQHLQSTLLAILAQAKATQAYCELLLAELDRASKVEAGANKPNCAEGRHPADAVKKAPLMGRPNRMFCTECKKDFIGGSNEAVS